jgi:hypothetical protein
MSENGIRANNLLDGLVGSFKSNPEGMLLLAAGAALLLRTRSSSSLSVPGFERASAMASEGKETVASAAGEASERARHLARAASDAATNAGQTIANTSSRVAGQAGQTLQQSLSRILQEQPLAIAAAGIAAGAALAAVFPPTEFEKQNLGAVGEQIAGVADQVQSRLKEAAGEAGSALKDAVASRGLDGDGFKDVAGQVAEAAKEALVGNAPGRAN